MGIVEQTTQHLVVLVTTSSEQDAGMLANLLIEQQLAACVTLLPVTSVYTWDGTIQRDQEWQLMVKTTRSRFADLAAAVQKAHSYEVPEIIALPIVEGSQSYLNWITDQVQGS